MRTPTEELDFQLTQWRQVVHMSDADKLREARHNLACAASQLLEQRKRKTIKGFLQSFIR